MMRPFEISDEQRLLVDYSQTLLAHHVRLRVPQINHACRAFRMVQDGETILNHVHTSHWVTPWRDVQLPVLSNSTVCWRLQLLLAWLRWLFDMGHVDANAFMVSSAKRLIAGSEQPVSLSRSLQRGIAAFMKERGPRMPRSQAQYRNHLERFNVFLNRHARTTSADILDENAVLAWLTMLWSEHKPSTAMWIAYVGHGFLTFLVETGRANTNPLDHILSKCTPRTFRPALQYRMVNGTNRPTPPDGINFSSALAIQFESHIALKRALGH